MTKRRRSDKSEPMPQNDKTYFQERAATEGRLAKQAKSDAAMKAHESLAGTYIEHVRALEQVGNERS